MSDHDVAEVYRDHAGLWRWRRVVSSDTVADSGQGYTEQRHALEAAVMYNRDEQGEPVRVEIRADEPEAG